MRCSSRMLFTWLCVGCTVLLPPTRTKSEEPLDNAAFMDQLLDMSLEELMDVNLKIVTASRQGQKFSEVPASTHVITAELRANLLVE